MKRLDVDKRVPNTPAPALTAGSLRATFDARQLLVGDKLVKMVKFTKRNSNKRFELGFFTIFLVRIDGDSMMLRDEGS